MKTTFKKTAGYLVILITGILIGSYFMFAGDNHADHDDHTETVPVNQVSQTDKDHSEHKAPGENDDQTESASGETFPITPVQQQLIGMQLDTVKNRSLQKHIRTIGRLTHSEPNLSEVVARVSGYIEKTFVNETGVHVHKGQKLMTVYSPELVSNQQDYLTALEGNNHRLAERARERLRLLNMPESEIERMEGKGEPLLEVSLVSPVSGHIMNHNVMDGLKFEPGSMLYRINDHTKLWLLADIYENDLPFIQLGQKVEFAIQGRPGEKYDGIVYFIPPMMNKTSRTIPVRIKVSNPDFKLKMDQYGWVTIHEQLGETLSVHRDAVLITGKRAVVFKAAVEGRFEPVEVHLGPIAGDYYQVLHGVEDGDRVVTNGRFWLDAESRLRGVGAEAMPEHQH
ncbi:MAG: efflux RND transporter periplasmic adaptor subunit [Balneolaceae bacterium]